MSIRSLWRPKWNPWFEDHGTARGVHAGRWPAHYDGLVWIKVKPQPEWVGLLHEIELEWGPWGRQMKVKLEEAGVVLATAKAKDLDGISRTCNVTTQPQAYALYGAGEALEGETIVDIRRGWSKVNPDASAEEAQYGPKREP